MLNNLTNFFNLIVGRRIKTQLEDSDLIAVGTKQSPALGDYKPTAIQFSDLQAQLGGLQTVSVDGVTITGDGTPGDPLVAVTGGSSYLVYTALLTQTGTDAPVATVLENTLGVNISYSYALLGTYHINSDQNIFLENNVVVLTGAGNVNFYPSLWIAYNGPAQLFIESYNMLTLPVSFTPQDGLLYEQFIEIRVYN
jgi:hypothetical protein